jgi:hypothetical protein
MLPCTVGTLETYIYLIHTLYTFCSVHHDFWVHYYVVSLLF